MSLIVYQDFLMVINNRPVSALRGNMSLDDYIKMIFPKTLLDFGNKLGMYNVDVLLGLEVYFLA